jgi:replicative DNA helicase
MTGFKKLDNATQGLHAGEMTILASRPSMGKSCIATNIASNLVFDGKKVLFFSLEMTGEQVFERLLCSIMSASLEEIHFDNSKQEFVEDALKLYSEQDFVIECPSRCKVSDIRQKFDQETLIKKPDVVIIDYLQLMAPQRKEQSREREVANISWDCLQFAKEYEVPVIIVCQLNRQNEERKVKRPMMSDLRESGALEQDAHNVWLLHRDDYYRARENGNKSKLDGKGVLIIAKNRQGPIGDVDLDFIGEHFLFRDPALLDLL